ncbi:MAG: CoA-binding protein [Oceanicoccus sp.]
MPLTSDKDIADVLRSVKTIALLGASHKPERPSYEVMAFLLEQGYTVIPVNPGLAGTELQGQRVYESLAAIPQPVDMIDVFRNASFLPAIVEDTISQGIGTIWTQLDVIDEAAAAHAENHGITVIMNRCPAIEWPRLSRSGLL